LQWVVAKKGRLIRHDFVMDNLTGLEKIKNKISTIFTKIWNAIISITPPSALY